MIVFLSDLHLSDETAGPPNVPTGAFDRALRDIAEMSVDAKAETVEIVFLGDVFELIRSSHWTDLRVPLANRPWGDIALAQAPFESDGKSRFPACEEEALTVMRNIIKRNAATFELFASDLTKLGFAVNPSRVFVPGNHDRIVNLFPRLRIEAAACLGLGATPDRFEQTYVNKTHRTFARHGHEWDGFNFEGKQDLSLDEIDFAREDYDKCPVGDILAAELASALPRLVLEELDARQPHHPLRTELSARLQDLFDIRPTTAMVEFLDWQIKSFGDQHVTESINGGLQAAARNVDKIPYLHDWLRRHDGLNPLDPADKIQILLMVLKSVAFSNVRKFVGPIIGGSGGTGPPDNLLAAAISDFKRLDRKTPSFYQYVLYGHTHQPDEQAVSVLGDLDSERPRMYLNTGRWRPMHNKAAENGFVAWKNLTYTVIYAPGEESAKGKVVDHATFETWSGTLKDD